MARSGRPGLVRWGVGVRSSPPPNRPRWLFIEALEIRGSLENCHMAAGLSSGMTVIVLVVRGFVALGGRSPAALGVLEEWMGG